MKPSYYTYLKNGFRYYTDDLNEVLDSPDIEEFTALYASEVIHQPNGLFFTFIGGCPSDVTIHPDGKDLYSIKTPKKGFFCFTIL